MKERPILFSGAMVRAILDGRKTQTRRVVKTAVPFADMSSELQEHRELIGWDEHIPGHLVAPCPYGHAGDRLWVRETTVDVEKHGYVGPVYAESQEGRDVINWGLAPTPDDCTDVEPEDIKLRPSIFMPRTACRLVLEINSVRVERLQSGEGEVDWESRYLAEGVYRIHHGDGAYYYSAFRDEPHPENYCDPFDAWRDLWSSINGVDSWNANAWVWVVEFKRVTP